MTLRALMATLTDPTMVLVQDNTNAPVVQFNSAYYEGVSATYLDATVSTVTISAQIIGMQGMTVVLE